MVAERRPNDAREMIPRPREAYDVAGTTIIQNPTRDDIEPRLHSLYDFWVRNRDQRGIIRKRDIDVLRFGARLLPHLILVEALHAQHDFRFRVIGTHICDAFGRDSTGRRLSELEYVPPYGEMIGRLYGMIAHKGVTASDQGTARWIDKNYVETRTFYMPVSGAEGAIDYILGGVVASFLRPETDHG